MYHGRNVFTLVYKLRIFVSDVICFIDTFHWINEFLLLKWMWVAKMDILISVVLRCKINNYELLRTTKSLLWHDLVTNPERVVLFYFVGPPWWNNHSEHFNFNSRYTYKHIYRKQIQRINLNKFYCAKLSYAKSNLQLLNWTILVSQCFESRALTFFCRNTCKSLLQFLIETTTSIHLV